MAIKDAVLYISPVPGGEMTARFAAGMAQYFRTEVTGLTLHSTWRTRPAFIPAYPTNRYRSYEKKIAKTLLLP